MRKTLCMATMRIQFMDSLLTCQVVGSAISPACIGGGGYWARRAAARPLLAPVCCDYLWPAHLSAPLNIIYYIIAVLYSHDNVLISASVWDGIVAVGQYTLPMLTCSWSVNTVVLRNFCTLCSQTFSFHLRNRCWPLISSNWTDCLSGPPTFKLLPPATYSNTKSARQQRSQFAVNRKKSVPILVPWTGHFQC